MGCEGKPTSWICKAATWAPCGDQSLGSEVPKRQKSFTCGRSRWDFWKKPGQLPHFDQNSEYWTFHSFCLLKINAPAVAPGLPCSAPDITCLRAAPRWRSRWGPPRRRGRWSVGLSSHPHTPGSTARKRPVLRHSPNAALSLVQHRGCWLETHTLPCNGILFPHIHTSTHHWHCFLSQGHCWNILLKARESDCLPEATPWGQNTSSCLTQPHCLWRGRVASSAKPDGSPCVQLRNCPGPVSSKSSHHIPTRPLDLAPCGPRCSHPWNRAMEKGKEPSQLRTASSLPLPAQNLLHLYKFWGWQNICKKTHRMKSLFLHSHITKFCSTPQPTPLTCHPSLTASRLQLAGAADLGQQPVWKLPPKTTHNLRQGLKKNKNGIMSLCPPTLQLSMSLPRLALFLVTNLLVKACLPGTLRERLQTCHSQIR